MTAPILMVILAHPDDETFPVGGTLAKTAAEGKHVHLITTTRGEQGIFGKSRTETAVLREAELRRELPTTLNRRLGSQHDARESRRVGRGDVVGHALPVG